MKRLFLALLLPLVMALSLPAQAEETKIMIRAQAVDAKFIGTGVGGVRVVVEDAETGEILDEGWINGGTGDKGGIHHEFSTRNVLDHGNAIRIELIDGPFRHLEGHWQFKPIGDNQGCRVQLDMDFEFSTRLLDLALGPVFTQISGSLVDAFCKRAQEIYGKR